jgi:cytochrome c553
MRWVGGLAAGALALLALQASGATPGPTPSFNPASAERGKVLAETCRTCHAVPGHKEGTPPVSVPKLAGQRPEAIFAALRDYQSGARTSAVMAPMAEALSLQDMRDLGAYLSAGGPRRPGTHGEGSWAHGKVRRDCTACHGESGMGVMPGVPALTGQHRDYLVHALNGYRDGTRKDATMGPVAKRLTPKEIGLLADYFAGQTHLETSK